MIEILNEHKISQMKMVSATQNEKKFPKVSMKSRNQIIENHSKYHKT